MVKKWDSIRDTLPHVVDRLVSLKDLHEQGIVKYKIMKYM